MAGWIIRPTNEWGETDLEVLGPGPCTVSISSVYEDDVAHSVHYVRYRIQAKRLFMPNFLAAILAVTAAVAVARIPTLIPVAIPVLVYIVMVLRARTRMLQAVAQMAIECGKPFGMTPAQDDFK
jgi:hypothetical protein